MLQTPGGTTREILEKASITLSVESYSRIEIKFQSSTVPLREMKHLDSMFLDRQSIEIRDDRHLTLHLAEDRYHAAVRSIDRDHDTRGTVLISPLFELRWREEGKKRAEKQIKREKEQPPLTKPCRLRLSGVTHGRILECSARRTRRQRSTTADRSRYRPSVTVLSASDTYSCSFVG